MILEIAIDSLSDGLAAASAGADRLEVCASLGEGGLSPSLELVRSLAAQTRVPLFVMIRPRGGDFAYSHAECGVMERHIDEVKEAGAHGIVLGLLTPEHAVDLERTAAFVKRSAPLPVTFHRAFDRCHDLPATAQRLSDIGVRRILTSGGAASAELGMAMLKELHQQVGRSIGILPGGGVRPANIRRLIESTGVAEIHSAARDAAGLFDPEIVRRMKGAIE